MPETRWTSRAALAAALPAVLALALAQGRSDTVTALAAVAAPNESGANDPCGVFDPPRASNDLSKLSAADRARAEECGRAIRRRASQASAGCLGCHAMKEDKEEAFTDRLSMHASTRIGCADCHGGRAEVQKAGTGPGERTYEEAKRKAHDLPPLKNPELWAKSGNPERSNAALLQEDWRFVRFINPGDLRVATRTCGPCHNMNGENHIHNVAGSPMTHGGMLYGAALYNNGVLPLKDTLVGESYDWDGTPRGLRSVPAPTPEETLARGILPELFPFPRWEVGQTGNPFRVFERGGRRRLEVGLPDREEDPGKPDKGLSPRGPGTLSRTDPIILGAQKTRLLDPMLSMLGTNDHAGDYRSGGCTACHVVYANDRDPSHSGPYAAFGNRGLSRTSDPTIPRDEPGHPLKHAFTRSIPSSQCITCHMHPGTNMVTTYLGYTWWDNEGDGETLYPKQPRTLSAAERDRIERANPDGAALKGLWSVPEFLASLPERVNPKARNTQFGDFHGHGWVFRAVFKRDRRGNLLDHRGNVIRDTTPEKLKSAVASATIDGPAPARDGEPVHLKDIHLEKGMHCVDCHFQQDNHGNGRLYGEPRAAIEIDCADCHGDESRPAALVTSGPAAAGMQLGELETPFGEKRFERRGTEIVQRSMVTRGLTWNIKPTRSSGNEKAEAAHTPSHSAAKLTCYACHSAWTTSCFGCHLSMRANEKKPNLHSEGGDSRNWTSYNFQTLRDDIFFLAKDGSLEARTLKAGDKPEWVNVKNRFAPARSACAVVVSSQNQNREWIYSQQQTVSGGGFSGTAFSTYVPHTVRRSETKTCTDCHPSEAGDNNAWMASLLMHGTGLMNFIGRYAYVGEEGHGFEAVAVTERDEPQAVIGSDLHEMAYPREYAAHTRRGGQLQEAYHHGGDVLSLQLRGEYLFAAQGKGGLRIYDVAQVDHKGFSERMVSAPFSPLGQRLYVDTQDATSVALPSTMTIDPSRPQAPRNQEQPVHRLYDYAYVTDREEGLVIVGPLHTLLDGDPRNNFVKRAGVFNPGGLLSGATSMTFAGSVAFVTTPRAMVVLDFNDPVQPRVIGQLGAPGLLEPRAVAVQFRYAFVLDRQGLKVVDITGVLSTKQPSPPKLVEGAKVALLDARNLYLARTYAYVAAGAQGLVIVDIEKPEQPRLDLAFGGGGAIRDAHDVKLGVTNGSVFAYVADGEHGLKVVQIISANHTPGAYGFSPRPTPELVATYKTHGKAVALSRGVDRDRAVDETGHQLSVFGRRGARPLTLEEQQRLYLKRNGALHVESNQ